MTRTPRQLVVDRLDLIGCGYIDRDTVSARCPLCGGVLAVTFTDIAVRLRCCDAGCPEDQIAAVIFNREPEAPEVVAAHRDRLIDVFLTAIVDEDAEELAA